MLIELDLNSLSFFLSSIPQSYGKERYHITWRQRTHVKNSTLRVSSCHDLGPFQRTAASPGHCHRPYHLSAALSLELSELLFGTGKALLRKTIVCTDTEVQLASPSPRLEEKILRVTQNRKEGLDRVNNLVRTISESGTWGVWWLINIICPHFSKILSLVVLSRGIIDFCLFHFIFFLLSRQQYTMFPHELHAFQKAVFFLQWVNASKRLG